MSKFIHKILIFSLLPIFVLLITVIPYIVADPYMDFEKKYNYSWKFSFQQLGDISTKNLINSTENYNSFIFGSSRSTGVYSCYLNKVVSNSSFFHYCNWNERIGGVYKKLKLIDSLGYEINNVIIYLDTDYSFEGEGKCHSSDHYLVTGEKKVEYLIRHFKSFYFNLNLDKIKILFGGKVSHATFPNWHSDLITNDHNHNCNDLEILLNYSKINKSDNLISKIDSLSETGFFYERSKHQQYAESQISKSEIRILHGIKKLLSKHSTNYHIVITPLYDQKKFSHTDKLVLSNLFGSGLSDFSGINDYTTDKYNFPDRKHFQPYISKGIIDYIYINKR